MRHSKDNKFYPKSCAKLFGTVCDGIYLEFTGKHGKSGPVVPDLKLSRLHPHLYPKALNPDKGRAVSRAGVKYEPQGHLWWSSLWPNNAVRGTVSRCLKALDSGCLSSAVWSWTNPLTSLGLCFPICRMEAHLSNMYFMTAYHVWDFPNTQHASDNVPAAGATAVKANRMPVSALKLFPPGRGGRQSTK